MPEAHQRLVRFLRTDLPQLVSAITGRALELGGDPAAWVWSARKGSYVDAGTAHAPEGGVDVVLGLTAGTWPREWGGHMLWRGDAGDEYHLPPGFDTLDILDGGRFVVAPRASPRAHPVCAGHPGTGGRVINPDLQPIPDELRARWEQTRNLRVDDFLEPGRAEVILDALRHLPHTFMPPTGMYFQMAMHENFADEACDHTLCVLHRWWFAEGRAWVEDLTGLPLDPPDSLVSTVHGKGDYLDPHNDKAAIRRIAFVLGFTPGTWPREEGGYLEFLEVRDGDLAVTESRPPGFNTLDLFDVQHTDVVHRISQLTEHHERRVVVGWFLNPGQ